MAEDKVNELQSGFTKARRVTDNLFILSYCIEENFRSKIPLYVIPVETAKNSDSVNRQQLVEALKTYKINANIMDKTAKLYANDATTSIL